MKKIMAGIMALALCFTLAACTFGDATDITGTWKEKAAEGTDQSSYQLTFKEDGTFEERIEPKSEQASPTTVSGKYTVDNGRVKLEVTGFSGGGMEVENLMDLGSGSSAVERQYEIEDKTLYLYESQRQEGRTEKAFEGKFVKA